MSEWVYVIIGLLTSMVLLLVYLSFRVVHALRNLTQARLKVYMDHIGDLTRVRHTLRTRLRTNNYFPFPDRDLEGEIYLIGSVPVMELNNKVYDAFADIYEKVDNECDENEVKSAIRIVDELLIELNVAMRNDLSLNVGNGQIPNADILWRNRGTK